MCVCVHGSGRSAWGKSGYTRGYVWKGTELYSHDLLLTACKLQYNKKVQEVSMLVLVYVSMYL